MSSANGSATASPRAVVLAGGVGTRLPPHSTEFPKPLVPLGGELAVIEVVLRQLRRQGFARITLAIGNLGGLVRAYCEDGSRWGIDLDYWTEDVPLGTMGPVIQHLDEVPEHLIVTNGDVLTDLDRRAFLADHIRSGASLSVATSERSTEVDFGVVEVAAGRIVGFHEKPAFPIVASMGGNAATQTMTVTVRALATKNLDIYNAGRIVRREAFVGMLNGAIFAAIMGLVAAGWFGDTSIGVIIGASMIINMLAAALAGILIPLLLDRFGIDPAVASSVFVTTVTDVVGFFSFLGLATWWLGLL